MPTQERLRTRGFARARRTLADFGLEIRNARHAAGLSQDEVGRRAGLSGDKIWKIEHEVLATLSIADACAIASILGLDFSARFYPTGAPIRDASQAARLLKLLSEVGPPLHYRTEVALPRTGEVPELRAWDAVISGHGLRIGIELESRLTDLQATSRRHNQKRADDPLDQFLFVVADSRHNRAVMAEFASLLTDLPRLRKAAVLELLNAGRHPPTGWMYF